MYLTSQSKQSEVSCTHLGVSHAGVVLLNQGEEGERLHLVSAISFDSIIGCSVRAETAGLVVVAGEKTKSLSFKCDHVSTSQNGLGQLSAQ